MSDVKVCDGEEKPTEVDLSRKLVTTLQQAIERWANGKVFIALNDTAPGEMSLRLRAQPMPEGWEADYGKNFWIDCPDPEKMVPEGHRNQGVWSGNKNGPFSKLPSVDHPFGHASGESRPLGPYAIEVSYPFDGGKFTRMFYGPSAEEAMKLYLLWEQGRPTAIAYPAATQKQVREALNKASAGKAIRVDGDIFLGFSPSYPLTTDKVSQWVAQIGIDFNEYIRDELAKGRTTGIGSDVESIILGLVLNGKVPGKVVWGSGTTELADMTFTQKVKADGGIGPAVTELLTDSLKAGKFDDLFGKKPPVGVIPHGMWRGRYPGYPSMEDVRARLADVQGAIARYKAAGLSPRQDWISEEIALDLGLQFRGEELSKPFAILKDGTRFMTAEEMIGRDVCESLKQIGVIKSASKCSECGERAVLEVQWRDYSYSSIFADEVELVK